MSKSNLLPLNFSEVSRLGAVLGNEGLGYAVRIIAYYSEFSIGPEETTIPALLGISKRKWDKIRPIIAPEFEIQNSRWVLPSARENVNLNPWASIDDIRPTKKSTLPLLKEIMQPSPGQKVVSSMTQHLFTLAIELFKRNGKTESAARACLGRLLKDWPQERVIKAFDEAWKKKDDIADVYPWIIAKLKSMNHLDSKNNTPIVSNRPQATPEAMGISSEVAARIRRNNQAKKLKIELD